MSFIITILGQKIQKAEFRQAGEKSICEVSVCEKKYNKDKAAEPEFDWLRLQIWEPPEWMVPKLKKGNFISATGGFQTRKFKDKEGNEKVSMECRCDTRSVSVVDVGGAEAPSAPAPAPRRPAAPADESDPVPF